MLFATDDWFAVAENMLLSSEPIFIADKFTDCGKWMDGWETRRKRIPGHDWCIIKLGAAAAIRGITVDTAHFTGNYAPRISVQGARLSSRDELLFPQRNSKIGSACSAAEVQRLDALATEQWTELLPMTKLRPGYAESRNNHIAINRRQPDAICTHLRINIYPDGGIARLRVYGEVHADISRLPFNEPIDLAAMQNGGSCVAYSNAHYGHPRNLIRPGRALNMGDGWETQRRLDRPPILQADERTGLLQVPGSEWAVLRLGAPVARLQRVVVDTLHFKGNFPESVRLEVASVANGMATLQSAEWHELLPPHKLAANREHVFEVTGSGGVTRNDVASAAGWNYIRVTMVPDGGISRVRVWGLRGAVVDEDEDEEAMVSINGNGEQVLRSL